MELGHWLGVRTVATVVVFLLAGCCFDSGQGSPQPKPQQKSNVFFPYFCPNDNTQYKLKFNQTESGYAQYTKYATQIPNLTSFTMHYWFNIANTTNSSIMFNYRLDLHSFYGKDYLVVQLESWYRGQHHSWSVRINERLVSRVFINTPIKKGKCHHALHSWNSKTGDITHFMDGNILHDKNNSLKEAVAVSGQHQYIKRFRRRDEGEGLNGWFTLFHLSSKPIGISSSSASAITKVKLAFQCSGDMEGDFISWTITPRKGYGGVTETPYNSKRCRRF